MRIAILGATGRLGQRLTARALELGFKVHVLARDPRRITIQNEHLTLLAGDSAKGEGLEAACTGCAFVVSALASSLLPVLDPSMAHLVPRLEQHKLLKRFVLVSRVQTGLSSLLPGSRDQRLAEGRVRASKLPWTILRATDLTDGAPTGKVAVVAAPQPPRPVARADFADFILSLCDPNSSALLHAEATLT